MSEIFRLLLEGETIQSSDEVLGADCQHWSHVEPATIGLPWRVALNPMRRKISQVADAPSSEVAYAMGAHGGAVVEAERLSFEAWMRGHCWALNAEWDGTTYRGFGESSQSISPHGMRARQLWAAWRDRAALSRLVNQRWLQLTLAPSVP